MLPSLLSPSLRFSRSSVVARLVPAASSSCRQFSASSAVSSSVLRLDEVTGTWVVFASGRKDRPQQTNEDSASLRNTKLSDLDQHVNGCPFCAGNEHMTPNTLLTVGDSGTRVVPNKYPAVGPLSLLDGEIKSICGHHAPFTDQYLLNNEIPAVGFHEVVIESPNHNAHIATCTDHTHARDLLTAFRERGREHRETQDTSIEHTVFFKNHGATAGASLVHPHSQIVSTPVVPVEASRLQTLAVEFFRKNRSSLYERICEEELLLYIGKEGDGASRVVDLTENFLAIVPYASAGPYTTVVLPRFNGSGTEEDGGVDCSDFTTTTDDLIDECALLLRACMVRLNTHLNEPCFNLVVQTAPVPGRGIQATVQASAFFKWHIRITPRLGAGAMAGFELGSGFFSNSHMPEDDASELRRLLPPIIT